MTAARLALHPLSIDKKVLNHWKCFRYSRTRWGVLLKWQLKQMKLKVMITTIKMGMKRWDTIGRREMETLCFKN